MDPFASLPPQAYTKETLAQAITWLQSQPDAVKGAVRNQDMLVTLYLKWKRGVDHGTPESQVALTQERLKSDFQHLKTAMETSTGVIVQQQSPQAQETVYSNQSNSAIQTAQQSVVNVNVMQAQQSQMMGQWTTPQPAQTPLFLDNTSREKLQSVKEKLNLSSELEAIRLLITVGYDKIRELFPKI